MEVRKQQIGNTYIRGIMQGAVRKGLDPYALLNKASVAASVYEDRAARIDGLEFSRLVSTIRRELNDLYLGFLKTPAKLPMAHEVMLKAVQRQTLDEANKAMNRFIGNYRNDFNYYFELNGRTHELCEILEYAIEDGLDNHPLYFCSLTAAYKFLCWLVGKRIKLTRVCFQGEIPDHGFDYEAFFQCDVFFHQEKCLIGYDERYLRSPIVRTGLDLARIFNSDSDWFDIAVAEDSLTSRIEKMLQMRLIEDASFPPVKVIAAMLAVNPRTIRRCLERENTSYQKIKTQIRQRIAIDLLLHTDKSIAVIAGKTGFAEPGDFTRAFTGWTGSTPTAYRLKHSGEDI